MLESEHVMKVEHAEKNSFAGLSSGRWKTDSSSSESFERRP